MYHLKPIVSLMIFLVAVTASWANLAVDVRLGDYLSGNETYVEVYALVFGQSVQLGEDGRSVEIALIIKNDVQSFHVDRFNLSSPHPDSLALDFGMMRRYALAPGAYKMDVFITDNSDTTAQTQNELSFNVRDLAGRPKLSAISLSDSIRKARSGEIEQKGGFILEPLGWSFTRSDMEQVYFYSEIYGTSDHDIVSIHADVLSEDGQSHESFSKKKHGAAFTPLLGKIDVSHLPSGNFKLALKLFAQDTLLDEHQVYFQNSNPDFIPEITEQVDDKTTFLDLMTADEIDYAIKAVLPRSQSTDRSWFNTVLQEDNRANKLAALKYQWNKLAPNNTEKIYRDYMEIARAIDVKYYSGYGQGFETDRGFYYLKYGQPDHVYRNEQEFDAPPYEMWTYNKLEQTGQADVKFIFYNPSLSPGNYELLHSTAFGEPNNPRWQTKLYEDVPNERDGPNHFDATQMRDGINRNAARRFNDF